MMLDQELDDITNFIITLYDQIPVDMPSTEKDVATARHEYLLSCFGAVLEHSKMWLRVKDREYSGLEALCQEYEA